MIAYLVIRGIIKLKMARGINLEIYNYMALIVRILLDNHFKADMMLAADTGESKAKVEELLSCESFSLERISAVIEENKDDSLLLTVLLQKLDIIAQERREEALWLDVMDFANMRCLNALNSDANAEETKVILLPRYNCIWEGKSREQHHLLDINTFLYHCFSVEVENGMIGGKYTVKNYILNPQYFGICMDDFNELFLQVSASPLTKDIELKESRFHEVVESGKINYFMIEELGEKDQEQLITYIEKVIKKADEKGDKILVFPEMLGTARMKEKILEFIQTEKLEKLHFIVFPSIWESYGKHNNYNTSYVLDYEGNEWFGQRKLRRYPENNENGCFLEDIIEGNEIHIIHCSGCGSIAVAICRSELDEDVREYLMRKLNIKLILCPSWSTGSHEFELSILTGIERNCNVVWCNTCSALSKEKTGNFVSVITAFGKNHEWSSITLEHRRFPKEKCDECCGAGCLFSERIYGTNYREGTEEADGSEEIRFI